MYKLGRTRVVANALSRLPDSTEPTCVPNHTTYASLFYTGLEWLNDAKEFFENRID